MKYNVPLEIKDNESLSMLLPNVRPNSTVLEFGCANGRMTRYMHEQLGCTVYIVEYEEAAFKDAIQYAKDGVCGDILQFEWLNKFSNIKFDHVIFADVLEHLYDPKTALMKAGELLKDDGTVLVSVPNVGHNDILIKLYNGRFDYTRTGLLDDTHIHFFAEGTIDRFFEEAGFHISSKAYTIMGTGKTEQFENSDLTVSPVLDSVLTGRKNGEIYQFILVLNKAEYAKEHGMDCKTVNDIRSDIYGKVYFDEGNGYSEEGLKYVTIHQNENGEFEAILEFELSDKIKSVRFDPVEGKNCLITRISASSGTQNLESNYANAFISDDMILLIGPDPQIVWPYTGKLSKSLYAHIVFAVEGTDAYEKSVGVLNSAIQSYSDLKNQLSAVKAELNYSRDELEQNKSELEAVKAEIGITKGKLDAVNTELSSSRAELDAVRVELNNTEEKLNCTSNELANCIKNYNSKQFELKEINDRLEFKERELVVANDALSALSRDMISLRHEYENQSLELQNANNQISSLSETITSTQDQLEQARRQSEDTYNRMVESNEKASFWESYAQSMRKSKSWIITKPLRAPRRIIEKLKNRKEPNEVILDNNGLEFHLTYDEEHTIKFSIVMPVYNVEIKWLDEAINSVKNQIYTNWELCIADDASTNPAVAEYLKSIQDPRIKVKLLETNGGISSASNEAAKLADGDYILLMDNDDVISSDALMEFFYRIRVTNPDVIYSDQDIVDIDGNHSCPVYKPDWSPDLFNSQMYLGHLTGFRRELFGNVGGFRKEFDGSQDYDLMFRIIEKSEKIEHVAKVLYSWRSLPTSTAADPNSKPYAQYAGLNAVQSHLDRTLGEGVAEACETENLFVYDVKYPVNDVKISIIIPTKDHAEDLKKAIDSIYNMSSYTNFEIIVLNNNSEEKKTYRYFDRLCKKHKNVKVVDAFYEFNWSKLNNHGISVATGDVYLFLNNDVEVLTHDWLERLASQAIRNSVGTVGALLLYEDGTIQHAGIVCGFGGWADHAYKGMTPIHYGTPFISPVVTRDVSAVTGACMAISKETVDKIGLFDENFIICGSDVEMCIRASKHGLMNVYDPHVKLYHYESKSRGSYIPQIDFDLSYEMYAPYREYGDPYYNNNLDYNSFQPKVKETVASAEACKGENEENNIGSNSGAETPISGLNTVNESFMPVSIPEITPINFRKVEIRKKRLNILLPSLNPEHVFGGISTALKFYEKLQEMLDYDFRVILTDSAPGQAVVDKYGDKYIIADSSDDIEAKRIIVPFNDRVGKTIPVSDEDYFIFTAWWTAFCIQEEYRNWVGKELKANPFIYFIQDYEPGFYAWSSHYMLADSTYRADFDQVAIFNSSQLKEYFDFLGYEFYASYVFEPRLNEELRKRLLSSGKNINKKKQILVYGRPNTQRNAFSLVVQALRKWVEHQSDCNEWKILSAGEYHDKVDLGKGMYLESVGKLTIDQYADTLSDSYAGVSLMVSPHPSYPPLEMAVFGVKVVTNSYANKDMSKFNGNIVSVNDVCPSNIANELIKICSNYKETVSINPGLNKQYLDDGDVFSFANDICKLIF